MIIVSVAPLLVLSWINYNQYQASISRETEVPCGTWYSARARLWKCFSESAFPL